MKINDTIEQLVALKNQRIELNHQVADLTKEIEDLERILIIYMENNKCIRYSTAETTISYNKGLIPNVVDWDDFNKYVKKHNAFELYERRPSVSACRELFETKGLTSIPGVLAVERKSIGTRKLT